MNIIHNTAGYYNRIFALQGNSKTNESTKVPSHGKSLAAKNTQESPLAITKLDAALFLSSTALWSTQVLPSQPVSTHNEVKKCHKLGYIS